MEEVDYEKVISDLERRKATYNRAVDNVIEGLRYMLSLRAGSTGAISLMGPSESAPPFGGVLTPDLLFGKSIPEAAIIALQVIKKPLHAKEVAEALENASYHHQSKNFVNTVNSILNRRADTNGDVLKIGKTWALAEWYPGRRKTPKSADSNGNTDDGSSQQ